MGNVHIAPASIDLSKAEMGLFSEMNRERSQRRGHSLPDFIRTSNNFAQVSRWWAALVDPATKDR